MPEDEIIEILLGIMPESLEGWLGVSMAISALLSIILPAPSENAHPVLKIGHKAICVLGLGAGKLKGMGKIGAIAKIGAAIRRKT